MILSQSCPLARKRIKNADNNKYTEILIFVSSAVISVSLCGRRFIFHSNFEKKNILLIVPYLVVLACRCSGTNIIDKHFLGAALIAQAEKLSIYFCLSWGHSNNHTVQRSFSLWYHSHTWVQGAIKQICEKKKKFNSIFNKRKLRYIQIVIQLFPAICSLFCKRTFY